MKIYKIFILFTLLILFQPLLVYAKTTDEIEINTLYKNAFSIVYAKIDISNLAEVDKEKALTAIDYIIEIYKRKPDSMEAYYATCFMKYLMKNTIKEKYDKMKEKHMSNLNDPDFETAEKLVFLKMMMSPWVLTSKNELDTNNEKAINAFINVRDNCKNKNYSALAATALSYVPNAMSPLECKNKIIELVPQHPAIPYIMGEVIALECGQDYQKRIEKMLELIDKYGNIETPNGCRMALEYYNFIAHAYVKMGDYDNAKKYFDIIVKEDSNYWNLRFLKSALSHMNNSDSK